MADLRVSLQVQRKRFTVTLDTTVLEGAVYCLFGPSAAGKSSLLSALAGFERSAAGIIRLGERVYLDSTSTTPVFAPPWTRPFGYVEQDAQLFPHLTVRGNITYGASAGKHIHGTKRPAGPGPYELAEAFGLTPYLDARPYTLSGGLKQRVALARALALRPTVLLLDEALSALDWNARRRLHDTLIELQRQLRFTMVLVTHQLNEAQYLSGRIGVLDQGRVLQEDSPDRLMDQPRSVRVASLLGYTAFIKTGNDLIAAIHPDRALLGRFPDRGVVFEATATGHVWNEGRRRLRAVLPSQEVIEISLSPVDAYRAGEPIWITAVDPPVFPAPEHRL